MEDQQPAAGDLTDEAGDDESRTVKVADKAETETDGADAEQPDPEDSGDQVEDATDVDETVDAASETDEGGLAEDAETAEETAEEAEPRMRTRKPVGKRLATVVAIIAVLFVSAAAFAGAMVQPNLVDRAATATKAEIVRTATNAITTLWSYTPDDLDKLADRAAAYLSGDFEVQYRKFVDALVAPNKQAQVTNTTEVTGAAVETLEGPTAVAIVYTNSRSTRGKNSIPSLRYLSYRLFMKRDHARWMVTRMTTVTSLDLTPRL